MTSIRFQVWLSYLAFIKEEGGYLKIGALTRESDLEVSNLIRSKYPIILDSCHRDAILELAGDVGCRRVIQRNPEKVSIVEMETDHVVLDIDRLEDYEALDRTRS